MIEMIHSDENAAHPNKIAEVSSKKKWASPSVRIAHLTAVTRAGTGDFYTDGSSNYATS